MSRVNVYPSGGRFHQAIAYAPVDAAAAAADERERFFWCLARGQTPLRD